MSEQKIILAQWTDKSAYSSMTPNGIATGYRWRVMVQPRDYNHEVTVYVQRTNERVPVLGHVDEDQWRTDTISEHSGKYILETLMEWGVPVPVTTEQRDEV